MREAAWLEQTASCVAGCTAGVARVLIGHPFDTLKVLRQTGSREPLPKIALFRLYRGCGPPLISASLYSSAAFTIYEGVAKEVSHSRSFVAGMVAGAVLAVPTCPLSNFQVLQQTSSHQRSVVQWAAKLRQWGLAGFFRGFVPHFLQGSLGRGCYMAGYDLLKTAEDRFHPEMSQSLTGKVCAACGAGVAGWIFTYPIDVARSNLISDWKRERYTGMLQTLQLLLHEGGLRRLYCGLAWTLLKAIPVAAVSLPAYDFVRQAILESRLCGGGLLLA
ncbi:unnamed protein product [Effrenium voratum]|nr:unnamed protein product [Effrenium voratum]